MQVRTSKWSWKHLAARLLLVPVLGATAGLANAQSFQSNWKNPGAAPAGTAQPANAAPAMTSPTQPTGSASGSPKEVLKAGRKALADGKLDMAQEYAMRAENAAAASKYKWGVFEDTPASLKKDVQAAADKANKAEAASLMKKAKALHAQKTTSDAERMANLDMAMQLATQAKSKHSSSGLFEMGEKPDALMADIRESQETLRKKTGLTPGATAKAPAVPAPSMPTSPVNVPASPIVQTGATTMAASPKADVLKIVAEGRALLAQDKVVEAKMKADMARKLAEEKGVLNAFTAKEDTPELLLTACKAKGNEMVKSLLTDADKQMAAGAYDKADAACTMALAIGNSMGFYCAPIEAKKQAIALKYKPAAMPVAAAPAAPEMLVPASNRNPNLDQAAGEMKRGELEIARTLAIRAFNDPKSNAQDKNEAQAILRQIDAEIAGRKRSEAVMAYNNAMAAYNRGDFAQAHAVLVRIDATVLAPDQKAAYDKACEICAKQINPITPVAAQQDPVKADMTKLQQGVNAAQNPLPVPSVPSNLVSPVTKPADVTIVDPAKAASDVAYDKLRTEAIEAMKVAGEQWNKGETDACMKTLEDYVAKVNATTYPPDRKMRLVKPVQSRIDGYGILKHNYDFELKEYKDKAETRNKMLGERVAAAQKDEEIKKKAQEVKALQDLGKYKEAEALALQMLTLDPKNPFCEMQYKHAKMVRRADDNKKLAAQTEELVYEGLQEADNQGRVASMGNPLIVDMERAKIAAKRGEAGTLFSKTEADGKVESQLAASYPLLKFENMPLKDVVDQIKKSTGVNMTIDTPTLEDEKISLESVVINEQFKDLSLHNALTVILEKARLTYAVENGVVKITTPKRLKGKLKTKVFHVMDLVTPIPEYKLSPHQTLGGAIEAGKGNLPPAIAGMGGATPFAPRTMPGGELISGGPGTNASNGGTLVSGNSVAGPNAMLPQRVQYAEQLKNMVTKLVQHASWADNGQGGGGSIAYYDIGGAMVVNQTADVIKEVSDLLESLRRLQDLSVAVEIRVISLSETYFERIGVDFQANITTNNASFERSLTTGAFRPEPFVNRIDTNGTTVGWSPATSFTSDLAIPIRPTSYNLTAPPFGGYQNSLSPTLNGGLSLGLAFLNDIQVYMFLEAAAGNRRINIMQAPKITLFNGQTSTVFVGDLAYFATGLQVYSANGQFVYLPVNQAFPIGQGFNPNGTGTGTSNGVSVTVQAIISADRRFVRLNLTPSLTALASATVPLYPITTFITPVFEGGSQGQPIPFTQFFQQPSFTEVSAQTTVAIPDGGTVLLGGLKTMAQGRNEFGPPALSQVPYLNRLFKNVGIGQETRHVMLMVTPRIIINSEEEARQTQQTTEGNAGGN